MYFAWPNQELAIQNYHIHEGDKLAWRGRLVNSIDASGLRPHHIIWKALDLIMWSRLHCHAHYSWKLNIGNSWKYTVFLRSDTAATIIFGACLCAGTIRGRRIFLWKARRHQRWLDEGTYERYSDDFQTLSVVSVAFPSCCQPWRRVEQHEKP